MTVRAPMSRHRVLVLAFWSAAVLAFVMAILPRPPALPGNPSDKMQHILAFFALTVLWRAAYPRVPALAALIALSAFGGLIEIVQGIPSLHRDSDWHDWLADTAAVAVAIGAVWLVGRSRNPGFLS